MWLLSAFQALIAASSSSEVLGDSHSVFLDVLAAVWSWDGSLGGHEAHPFADAAPFFEFDAVGG